MTDNPLWLREVRARMRGGKAYLVLLFYALLLTLVSGGVYLQWLDQHAASGDYFGAQAAFRYGKTLYQALFTLQAVLIALITPAITAGAITLEREQRTLEMMALTRLSSAEVVSGKLAAAVAFVALLLTSSLPLVSLAFFLGGVSPGELFFTYLTLLFAALFFGAVGICCSALVPGTAAATVLAFGGVGAFLIASVATIPILMGGPGAPQIPFRSVSPISAVTQVTSREAFLLWGIPSWLPAVVILGLAALLAANVAMARLEFFHDTRTAPIRWTATALWGAFFLHLIAHTLGLPGFLSAAYSEARATLMTLLGIDLALLLLLIPPFATGPLAGVRPGDHLRGLLPHRAFREGVATGTLILLLWLLLPVAIMLGGVAITRPTVLGVALATLLPAATAALAMTAAFIAIGHALSAWLPSRGPALALLYALIAAATLLPYVSLVEWHAPLPTETIGERRLAWNLLYLTPFAGFTQLADPAGFRNTMPPTLLGSVPFWLVTTVIYTVLALTFGAATLAGLARAPLGKVVTPAKESDVRTGADPAY